VNSHAFAAAVSRGRDGLFLNIHVQPGARRQQLSGLYGDAIKIAVQARAVDGKANDAVVSLIADALGLPRRQLRLVAGRRSRRKRICIEGEADMLMRRLSSWLGYA